MSKNATISIQKENGKIYTIYNHWDSIPSELGVMLKEHYNSAELAMELISMGDASYVGPKIHPQNPETHDFSSPEPDVCLFYKRDRGEDDCEMKEFDDIDDVIWSYILPFNYLFKVEDNRWYCIIEEPILNHSLYDLDEAIKEYNKRTRKFGAN